MQHLFQTKNTTQTTKMTVHAVSTSAQPLAWKKEQTWVKPQQMKSFKKMWAFLLQSVISRWHVDTLTSSHMSRSVDTMRFMLKTETQSSKPLGSEVKAHLVCEATEAGRRILHPNLLVITNIHGWSSVFVCAVQGDLMNPCRCDGSVRYTHQQCLLKWISERGCWTCELCCYRFQVIAINMKRPWQVKRPNASLLLQNEMKNHLFCRCVLGLSEVGGAFGAECKEKDPFLHKSDIHSLLHKQVLNETQIRVSPFCTILL